MSPYYAEFRCLSVAFALWGNRCQSVALTDRTARSSNAGIPSSCSIPSPGGTQ